MSMESEFTDLYYASQVAAWNRAVNEEARIGRASANHWISCDRKRCRTCAARRRAEKLTAAHTAALGFWLRGAARHIDDQDVALADAPKWLRDHVQTLNP